MESRPDLHVVEQLGGEIRRLPEGAAGRMERRVFVASLAFGILATPRVALPQSARKAYRVGVFSSRFATSEMAGPQPREPHIQGFLRGMADLGYVYGEHFVTEPRGGEGKPGRFPDLAIDLVRTKPDVIVSGGPLLPHLKRATSTIPVVMAGAGDPVAEGYVQSLSRPGGNFTGLSLQFLESTGKRLELLKEIAPGGAAVAVLWSRTDRTRPSYAWQAAESAARDRGWKLISLEIQDAAEIEGAFKEAARARAGGLFVHPTGHLDRHALRIAELAEKGRLPAVYGLRYYVEVGGLMSYAPDSIDMFRRSAAFVDKILKGARPADLPVEQPTKFELLINLKAAKAIGLAVPQHVLSRADEILQ
jgi:putative ABC transport system substrate-binding protein